MGVEEKTAEGVSGRGNEYIMIDGAREGQWIGEWKPLSDGSGNVARMEWRGLAAEIYWRYASRDVPPYEFAVGGVADEDIAKALDGAAARKALAVFRLDGRYLPVSSYFGEGSVSLSLRVWHKREAASGRYAIGMGGFLTEEDAKTVAEAVLLAAAERGAAR